jgi:hypothetical protein
MEDDIKRILQDKQFQIRAEGNNTICVGKKRFNGSVTHGLRKEHVLRSPFSFGQGKIDHICKSSPMILCGNRSFLEVT